MHESNTSFQNKLLFSAFIYSNAHRGVHEKQIANKSLQDYRSLQNS